LSRSWLATLGTGAFCYAGVQMSLTTFLALYYVEYIGLTLAGAGLMVGIFQMSGLVARIIWGSLADRLGERVPLFAGIGLLIAIAVTVFLSLARPESGYPTFIAATIILGTICNSWTGLYFAEIVRAVPENEMGRATGLALMVTFAGVVIIPPGIGIAVSAAGFPIAFALIGALGGVGSVCGYIARRRSPGADRRR
jgi:nitrate/nitrite transporter NarK